MTCVTQTPDSDIYLSEIIKGLSSDPKSLSPKFLYDEKGSLLFDQICQLPEYYPTRTEQEILEKNIHEISESIGQRCCAIELGSGSSLKTRLLLKNSPNICSYVPVDISSTHLDRSAQNLRLEFPHLNIYPLIADYTQPIQIPETFLSHSESKAIIFLGSSIGNFDPSQALRFLKNTHALLKPQGMLLIGVDLQKDKRTLELAYNDQQGVTAAFNLNLLYHLNSEYRAQFNPSCFAHRAYYNQEHGRIEMHLISLEDQIIYIQDQPIRFKKGESIHTESSYKYTIASFQSLAKKAAFTPVKVWVDSNQMFSIHLLQSS